MKLKYILTCVPHQFFLYIDIFMYVKLYIQTYFLSVVSLLSDKFKTYYLTFLVFEFVKIH